MFISWVTFRIRPDKQTEFLPSIRDLMERTRGIQGCFGCRLMAEIGEFRMLTLVAEWGDRDGLDRFLQSHRVPDYARYAYPLAGGAAGDRRRGDHACAPPDT